MIQEYQIRVLPVQAASTQTIIEYLAREKGLDARTVNSLRVLSIIKVLIVRLESVKM